MDNERLAGKKILVTGASRGIGAAGARLFAAEGAAVAVTARNADALSQLVDEITTAGGTATAVVADFRETDQVRRAVAEAHSALGGLDGAFNNAGIFERTSPLDERTDAEFADLLQINLAAQSAAMVAQIDFMRSAKGGSIVNTSSIAGLRQYPMTPVYSATKRALNSLTESAAASYGPDGVRVNAVAAGLTLTDMVVGEWESERPGIINELSSMIPLRRAAKPEEIAAAAAWLLSDAASFVTGAILPVTGGAHL